MTSKLIICHKPIIYCLFTERNFCLFIERSVYVILNTTVITNTR